MLPARNALQAVMQRGADTPLSDDAFNDLALQAFAHQFEHNLPYRRFCERRGISAHNISSWTQVPAVPTAAFKEVPLVAGDPAAAQQVFRTSGTTRGEEKRGTHYVLDASLYEDSLLATFRSFVLAGHARMRFMSLMPPFATMMDSSLAYMIDAVLRAFGETGSRSFVRADGALDSAGLDDALRQAEAPVCIVGTSLALLHWLEQSDVELLLPAGSRIMDTGGFKGESRATSALELRTLYGQRLGVLPRYCVNEYGMTELCSQYYDAALRDAEVENPLVKKGPPWLRARIVDPETLDAVASGETGILQHFDLANLNSVCAVLTEDLAYEAEGGFVLMGRAPGAMPRGCSIAMDMLLSAARTP